MGRTGSDIFYNLTSIVIMAITGHTTLECFQRYDAISPDDLKQAVGSI